jgi:hypothetical protein
VKIKWIFLISAFFVSQTFASELLKIYEEDQAVRTHLRTLPNNEVRKYITEVMLPKDKIRLAQVENILKTHKNLSSKEYFAAAMIMQHGSEPEHYQLAMELSKKSANLDPKNKNASWLACAAEDRYLIKIGKKQIWGTQLKRKMNYNKTFEIYYLENFDKTARSDTERTKCGIPTLSEIKSRLDRMEKIESRNKQYSLWKTGT